MTILHFKNVRWTLTMLLVLMVFANTINAQTTVTSRVSSDTDDAEQRISNGSVNDGDNDLELAFDGGDNQLIGFRFQNVNVPTGAIISNATIQFTTANTDSGLTSLTISGQNADNPSTFLEVNNNISTRPLTLASVAWNSIPAWNTNGQAGPNQRTPNLSNIIQEIILRAGWNQGQAMAFVISGTGTRRAESHNGSATQAALLSITYTLPPLPPNANDDNFATYNSNRVDMDVLANDTDPNNNLDPYSLTNTTALVVPGEGEYEIRPNNTIRFTPEPTFVGTSTLGYSICDDTPAGSGGPFCDTATLSVQVVASPCGVGQVVTGGNAFGQSVQSENDWRDSANSLGSPDSNFSEADKPNGFIIIDLGEDAVLGTDITFKVFSSDGNNYSGTVDAATSPAGFPNAPISVTTNTPDPAVDNITFSVNQPGIRYVRVQGDEKFGLESVSFQKELCAVAPPDARVCTTAEVETSLDFSGVPAEESGDGDGNYEVGEIFRYTGIGPGLDALVTVVAFNNGASLLNMDVPESSNGIERAFQPNLNSTNSSNQSVDFNIAFVVTGSSTPATVSFYATALDIDGSGSLREYVDVSYPETYTVQSGTSDILIGEPASEIGLSARSNSGATNPGIDANEDYAFSAYYENRTSIDYRVGKYGGDGDRLYSILFEDVVFSNPENNVVTSPLICGQVTDAYGNPLSGIDISLSDGQMVTTDAGGFYLFEVVQETTYTVTETIPPAYTASSDAEGSPTDGIVVTIVDVESRPNQNFVLDVDADGDGIGNYTDLDNDNDGIPDSDEVNGNEPFRDEDGDGIPNGVDTTDDGNGGDGSTTNYTDGNGDGVPDVYDTDGDGVGNHLDLDADNDGIYDAVEAGHGVAHTNGVIAGPYGANGLANSVETAVDSGVLSTPTADSDSDGTIDSNSLDADGNACPDVREAGYTDDDGDWQLGPSPVTVDANGLVTSAGDGYTAPRETNAGTPDYTDAALLSGCVEICGNSIDDDGDGDVDEADSECFDCDSDGVLDIADLDDDNDGIPDTIESPTDSDIAGTVGIGSNVVTGSSYPMDGNSIFYTTGFPAGEAVGYNTTGQGPAIRLQNNVTSFRTFRMDFATPVFDLEFKITDLDATEDIQIVVFDESSNRYNLNFEGIESIGSFIDIADNGERLTVNGTAYAIDGENPANDNLGTVKFNFPGAVSAISMNIRVANNQPIFITQLTFQTLDSDNDGILDKCDLDADNDGIYDAVEAGHGIAHTAGRLVAPFGANGLANSVETAAESGVLNYSLNDSDTDTIIDALELDSDNDGCSDANEAYADSNADGGDNDYYGTGNPPATGPYGVVTAASYATPADGDTSGTADYREADVSPTISSQPANSRVCDGCTTTFTVTGANNDTYQWQLYNGATWDNLSNGGVYSGVTTNTLTISGVELNMNGNQYRVVLTNEAFICDPNETSNIGLLNSFVNTVITNRRITVRTNKN